MSRWRGFQIPSGPLKIIFKKLSQRCRSQNIGIDKYIKNWRFIQKPSSGVLIVFAFLQLISWLSCPLLAELSACPFLAVLTWPSCPDSPVLAVLSLQSCPGSPVRAVLSGQSCPSSPVSGQSCPGNHVLKVLSWQSCPESSVLAV
jgi:hypothetical protein